MEDISGLQKPELVNLARNLNLSTTGNKPDLVDRIEREWARRNAAERAPSIEITDDDDPPPQPEPPAPAAGAEFEPRPILSGIDRSGPEWSVAYDVPPDDFDRGLLSTDARHRLADRFEREAGPGLRGVRLVGVLRPAGRPALAVLAAYPPRSP